MFDKILTSLKERPQRLFYLCAAFLAVSLIAVFAVDVANIFSLRDRWFADVTPEDERYFLWFHWFEQPVENPMQWGLLGATAWIFAAGAGAAFERDDQTQFQFSLLLSIGVILMFIEDAASPRHVLRFEVETLIGGPGGYGVAGTVVELVYFAFIGSVMLFAVLAHRRAFWDLDIPRKFLLTGYALYAVAVGSSWLGSAFGSLSDGPDLYTWTGEQVAELLFFDDGPRQQLFAQMDERALTTLGDPLSFYLMDRVWEESLELLGATALLVAAISFFHHTTTASKTDDE